MEFRLPVEKISALQNIIAIVIRCKKVILKDIAEAYILAFASRVLPIGRIFSRHLYLPVSGLKSPTAHIKITTDLRADLLVWSQFFVKFNGRAIFQEEFVSDKDFCLFTDNQWVLHHFGIHIGVLHYDPLPGELKVC